MTDLTALESLTPEDRGAVVEWQRDCAVDARRDEPGVGIFGNDRMAAAFDALAALAAGTRSAETSETSAPSEGCQSGPKGNAQ